MQQIIKHLFGADSLEEVSRERLETLVTDYPSFGMARYLLSRKLKTEEASNFREETQKTNLYFSNPLWLHWLLQNSLSSAHSTEERPRRISLDAIIAAEASPVEEPAIHPEETNIDPTEEADIPATNEMIAQATEETAVHSVEGAGILAVEETEPIAVEDTTPIAFEETRPFGFDETGPTAVQETSIPDTTELTQVEYPTLRSNVPSAEDQGTEEYPTLRENQITEEELPVETASDDRAEKPAFAVNAAPDEPPVPVEIHAPEENPVPVETPALVEPPAPEENPVPVENPVPADEVEPQPSESSRPAEVSVSEETHISAEVPAPPIIQVPEPAPIFESYHTIDYFASLGIKLTLDENPSDKLGKQLKSFTDWLKVMRKIPQKQQEFPVPDEVTENKIQRIAAHSIEGKEVLTETMAEVLAKQGMYQKASEVYHKLSLLNPEKRAYFAAKIEQLKID